jgi:flavin-dependent dehydrogenase
VTFHYLDLPPVRVSIKPGAGVDALYAPRRHLLDRILVDAAAAAGADVLHGTAVTGVLRDEAGRVRGVAAGRRELRAGLTVGADGIRSAVARDVGARVVRQGAAAGAVLYRYLTGLPADGYEWAYARRAAAGLIPTNDGRTCVFVSSSPDRMHSLRRAGAETAFRELLGAAAPALADRVAEGRPAGRIRGWGGVPGFVRRSAGPGWALVGDAGYFKDPITAHGMTDALRDAELLADQVVEACVAGTPEAVALNRYQATRDRLSGQLFEATEEVAGYAWDTARVQALLRQVSAAMTDEVELLSARPALRDPDQSGARDLSGGSELPVGSTRART